MKIALICDTHWGVRNDNPAFINNNRRFCETVFFPYLLNNRIGHVIHLGDLVDRRKYINIRTARALREDFLDPLCDHGIYFDIIAGNHDVYYKNTNGISSLFELVRGERQNVHINPYVRQYPDCQILLLPWITDDNKEFAFDVIKNSDVPICTGHLELEGYEMYKGVMCFDGLDAQLFGRFDRVYTGHFHHRSVRNNIHYLGSHAQFTWSDYNDSRGFHILDTRTLETEFIENPYTMFQKVWYDDRDVTLEDLLGFDFAGCVSKFVKVIVTARTNPYWFDKFIEELEKAGVIDLQIVEDHRNLDAQSDETLVNEAESTIDIMRKYIEVTPIPGVSKPKLEKIIEELHTEALSVE